MGYKWTTEMCSTCEGSGRVSGASERCDHCGGSGRVHSVWHGGSAICRHCCDGFISTTEECTSCKGRGRVRYEVSVCDNCGNEDCTCSSGYDFND